MVKNVEKEIEVKGVKPVEEIKVDYASFGDKILADKAISKDDMIKKYKSLKVGDTLNVKFKSKIKEVCKKKGCWMAMELPGGKESFVKFKDYAFFVPLNADNQEAIVSGKAFVSETSVAQLRHYAKDGGKSEAEIAKITEPEFEYKFLADGVLIRK
ncbi:branched-chain amino acid aminotransferase [Flavobacterium psychrophilum]|nr:branched-chain amino acid aminotransferase [Flavobacterium psychrophilum]AOE54450.1 branched-chain amino acid aminotransferase [Flavobacterium psychrophilum]